MKSCLSKSASVSQWDSSLKTWNLRKPISQSDCNLSFCQAFAILGIHQTVHEQSGQSFGWPFEAFFNESIKRFFFFFVSLSNAQRFAFFSKREHFDYKLKTDRQRDWTVHLCWCLGAEAIFHWFLYWFCGVWQLAQYNHSFTSSFNLITDTEHTVCVATFSLCFLSCWALDNYLSWTWVSIAGFAFSLSFFSLLFFWELRRCENVCISHWQGKKENKPQPFLYTKLQGGWKNLSLNALWCCLFEWREPSPALWSGFPAHMPLQMLFCLVLPPIFLCFILFLSAVSQLRPPCSSGLPPRQFCKTSSCLCFEVLQHDQYEVESGSWTVYWCVFTVKVHVIMGRR